MAKVPSSVTIGGVTLPVGFRFNPNDEELVASYLRRMVLELPLPINVIPFLDVFQVDPWKLPGVGDTDFLGKGYFFCEKSDVCNGGIVLITEGTGFWRVVGDDVPVVCARNNIVIGTKKTLVFRDGENPAGETETPWVMHEFRLAATVINADPPKIQTWSKWAVYQVYKEKKAKPKKKRGGKKNKKARKAAKKNDSDETAPPPESPNVSEGSVITSAN